MLSGLCVPRCSLMERDMANQDVAGRGRVVARHNMKSVAIVHVVPGKKKGGVLVLRRSHDGTLICHLRALMHNMCGGSSTLVAWEVASCAKTAGGSPVTGRSKVSVICNVHSGARSREGVAHRALLSVPRSQERTVELHLDVPMLQLHVSSATSSKSLQFLGGARNNLELARSTKHGDSSPTCQSVFVCEGTY